MAIETLIEESQQKTRTPSLPPLENGDHLTREEFERRYHAMPKNIKAELIEGVVYMSSPVRYKNHGEPNARIIGWLFNYCAGTKGVGFAENVTLKLDTDNEPQPDAVLRIDEFFGGSSFINDADYLEGAPELVVEIAGSTASYDSHEKLKIYRRNGIQEYIIWRVYDKEIDWYSLQNEQYVKLSSNEAGIIESRIFAGLRINVEAMLNGDLSKVLSDLQEGINTPEHESFVQNLKSKKSEGEKGDRE